MRRAGLRHVVLIGLLAAPLRAGAEDFLWTLDGCATLHGDTLVLQSCTSGGCGGYGGEALGLCTVPGTLSLQLHWSSPTDALFELLTVLLDGDLLLQKGYGPWCSSPPCSGDELLVTPVAAGQLLRLDLSNVEQVCLGGVTCTLDVQFVPTPGISAGIGGLDARLVSTVQGVAGDDFLGAAIALLGDLDGDGLADLAASAPGHPIRCVSGATGAPLFTIPLPPTFTYQFGGSLASAGDIDGDGIGDLIAGTGGPNEGNGPVRVFSGAGGQLLLTISAPSGKELFGTAVDSVGDLNHDGVPDVLVGAPGADVLGKTDSGAGRVYSGATGQPLAEVSGAAGDFAGYAVAGLGDVNGDGHPDYAVGAPFASVAAAYSGVVRVHSGAGGGVLHDLPGPAVVGADLGWRVASGADFDADGRLDVLASSLVWGGSAFDQGLVRGFSSASGALLFEHQGEDTDGLGEGLACLGDWDGDGHDDALAGGNHLHAVQILSGVSGATLQTLSIDLPWLYAPATPNGTAFGRTCAGGGDCTGDGVADFAVGAEFWAVSASTPPNVGKTLVYSGSSADYVPPLLAATGTLQPLAPLALSLSGGDALAPALLVVGGSAQMTALKSGLLVPHPDLLLPLVLDAGGALQLPAVWPAGLPAGAIVWLQAWLPDADGFAGWFASNTLFLVAP